MPSGCQSKAAGATAATSTDNTATATTDTFDTQRKHKQTFAFQGIIFKKYNN